MTSWRDSIEVHPAADLFPPLVPAALAELVDDIKSNSMLVPVVTWRDWDGKTWLIDGRNRLDAREQLDLPCVDEAGRLCVATDARSWETDPDPFALVVSLNIHRRHLTGEQRRGLVAKLLQAQPEKSNRQIAAQVKVDDKTVGSVRHVMEGRAEIPHVATRTDTRGRIQPAYKSKQTSIPLANSSLPARIVKMFGDGGEVSVRKVASKVLGNVAPSYVATLMDQLAAEPGDGYRVEKVSGSGNDAIWRVATAEGARVLPIEPTKAEKRAERERVLAERILALPDKKYGLIYDDCEWRFEPWSRETGMDRAADNHYPTSELLTLMQRDVASIAARDCILLHWATVPMLIEAICVADAWGFCLLNRDPSTGFLLPDKRQSRYVSNWAWFKQRIATGYWNRGKHELLLCFTRGNPVAPAMGQQLPSCFEGGAIEAPTTGHSVKPEVFLEWIEKLWPNTPKIELNRRGPARPGWDAWGNEALPPEDLSALRLWET